MIRLQRCWYNIFLPTLWLVLLALFLFYYLWNAHQGFSESLPKHPYFNSSYVDLSDFDFDCVAHGGNYYSDLSDALIHGQLHLLAQPHPELLALSDPYDPKLNKCYRVHDLSLYEGRWYMYFGITPALLMWIPARMIGLDMSYQFATAVFCWGGLLGSLGFLLNIVRISGLSVRRWMWIVAIPLLALGNAVPYLLQRAHVYETAISAAYFCTVVGLCFLSRFFAPGNGTRWSLAIGGVFLALAVGARPTFIFWGVTILLVSYLLARRHGGVFQRSGLREQMALWAPYIAFGIMLALYNYLRFGSFTEFGGSYQLAAVTIREFFSTSSLLPNFYFNLWQPPKVDYLFPFFHAAPSYPGTLPPFYIGPERVAGAFRVTPFLYLLLVVPLIFLVARVMRRENPIQIGRLPAILASVLVGQAAVQIFLLGLLASATMRYLVDFMPYLLLAAVLLWFAVDDRLAHRTVSKVRNFINLMVVALVAYGSVVNLGLGMTGHYDHFKIKNPNVYQKIANIFDWVNWGYRVGLSISQEAEGRDPLMHTGTSGKGDLVFMERSNGRFRVGIDHWHASTVWSGWRPLKTPATLELTIIVSQQKIAVYEGGELLVTSLNAPYSSDDDPIFGENRLGFTTAPKRARFALDFASCGRFCMKK